jgi:spore germination protein GerM
MMKPSRRALTIGVATVAVALMGLLLTVGVPRWYSRRTATPAAQTTQPPPAPTGPRIKAQLFYVAEDGAHLIGVERDVPFAEGTVEQARRIIEAQIAPVAEPLVSAVPHGTKLRALFVTDRGDAYVDLSREMVSAHSGGSLNELLTVYTIIEALTVNLPAVISVQLLVEGKELDTLAGHVDLRRPLARNLAWVQ